MGFGFLGLMMLSVVLLVVGVVLLVVWLARQAGSIVNSSVNSSAGSSSSTGKTSPSIGSSDGEEKPLTILQRRYARGEIGPEEYERIRSDLLRDGGGQ